MHRCYSWGQGSGNATLLGAQLTEILFVVAWTFFIMMPFFIFLDWKGWFRSDPLEEIVGLDTSYHGGCILGDSDVQPEYISAYKQRRAKKRASRGSVNSITYTDSPIETALRLMDEEEHNYGGTDPARSSDDNDEDDDDDDEEAVPFEDETGEGAPIEREEDA